MIIMNEKHRLYVEQEAKLLAEITFPFVKNQIVDINHTFVHTDLRGQGMAGVLMREAAAVIRGNQWKCITTCPYALAWMKKHPKEQDIWLGEGLL